MKRVLVAEDEASIREFVVINLKRNGYDVVEASDGAQAIEKYKACNGDIDVAILDIMMPYVDGLEVCKQLRAMNANLGIIMLTAKTQEMDKVSGLLIGADDYVTKPFSTSELMARVDVLYRRVEMSAGLADNSHADVITSGEFELNMRNRTLTKNGVPIELTQVEYHIMEYLLKNRGTALDRKTILHHIWGEAYYGDDKVVDVNIRRLRMKIEDDPSDPQYIQTIWGFGYKWNG